MSVVHVHVYMHITCIYLRLPQAEQECCNVLLYYYYGGMLHVGLKNYGKALEFFGTVGSSRPSF